MCCLGMYYLSGEGVEKNEKKAFGCFERAAQAGIPAAQYNLAVLYRYGTGTEMDEEKALHWMTKAAQQGFALAVKDLNGEETTEDE